MKPRLIIGGKQLVCFSQEELVPVAAIRLVYKGNDRDNAASVLAWERCFSCISEGWASFLNCLNPKPQTLNPKP